VASIRCSAAPQVAHRFDAVREYLSRLESLPPAAVAQPLGCGHVAALDGLGRCVASTVQPCADVPSAWRAVATALLDGW
jgi:hypothetical protein